jgi:hypothetical protein
MTSSVINALVKGASYEELQRHHAVTSYQRPPDNLLPLLPERYKARETDLADARAKLLGTRQALGIISQARAVGLQGMGGIGKTVLAAALVQDPAVRERFSDGICWLTFGRDVLYQRS